MGSNDKSNLSSSERGDLCTTPLKWLFHAPPFSNEYSF